MDIKVDNNINFSCNICDKIYSSYKSLWNHNSKFHNKKIDITQSKDNHMQSSVQSKDNHMQSSVQSKEKSLLCKNCNKLFTHRNNRWRHEQKCKNKEKNIDEIANLKEQNKKLESTINELKIQVTMILKEKGKIHHKTLQKINNQLNNESNQVDNQMIELKKQIYSSDIGTYKFIAKSFNVEIETVVKWFIFVIVIVFDPLAVALILSYNISINRKEKSC